MQKPLKSFGASEKRLCKSCTPKVPDFTDQELLEHIEFHSRTENSVFSKEIAERFFALAGRIVKFESKSIPMPIGSIKCDLSKAWKRLFLLERLNHL